MEEASFHAKVAQNRLDLAASLSSHGRELAVHHGHQDGLTFAGGCAGAGAAGSDGVAVAAGASVSPSGPQRPVQWV